MPETEAEVIAEVEALRKKRGIVGGHPSKLHWLNGALTPAGKDVLMLRELAGLSYGQLAKKFGVSKSAVIRHCQRYRYSRSPYDFVR
jgi:hypothetical protein